MRDRAAARRVTRSLGKSIDLERMEFGDLGAFDYRWAGERYYLALHQIQLQDGETEVESLRKSTITDLRNRITYAPAGCSVTGWTSLKGAKNGYLALTFDASSLDEGDGFAPKAEDLARPLLYFRSQKLAATLSKIAGAASDEGPGSALYLDLLAMTAILELGRLEVRVPSWNEAAQGALSGIRARRVVEFIEENFDRAVTLSDLAAVAELSKFHFVRAFKQHFGTTPHSFVTMRRLEKARSLLENSSLSIADIGLRSGYKTPEGFASSFRQAYRMSPSAFRKSVRVG